MLGRQPKYIAKFLSAFGYVQLFLISPDSQLSRVTMAQQICIPEHSPNFRVFAVAKLEVSDLHLCERYFKVSKIYTKKYESLTYIAHSTIPASLVMMIAY